LRPHPSGAQSKVNHAPTPQSHQLKTDYHHSHEEKKKEKEEERHSRLNDPETPYTPNIFEVIIQGLKELKHKQAQQVYQDDSSAFSYRVHQQEIDELVQRYL
jgi:hypothetical protein